jgi:hypothetical protein
MRATPRSGGVPFWRILGLLVLGCAVTIGLLPSHRTVVALILSLSVGFLILWLVSSWRQSRFVLREDDGTLPPLWAILLGGLGWPVLEGFIV